MKKIVSMCLMLAMSMMMWADQALFLVPNSNWLQADAKFAVYYFGGDNTPANGWSNIMFAQPDETNVYMTYIPDGYTNVIFVRLNSTATAGSFADGVKWNQTADIALPVDGRDMMTLEDGWDNISGTWSIHGLVPEPQDTTAVEVNYYIKNNWNNAAWTWLQMESNANGIFYSAMGVFGGTGVNINTAMSDEGAVWYPVDSMHVIGEQVPAALDTVVFHYYPATPRLTAQVMGSHAVEPIDTTIDVPTFYLTGDQAFVGEGKQAWNKDDAYVSYGDTLVLNLAAGTYEMKLITPDDQWLGYSALTEPVTAGITTNSWGNIVFTLNVAGDVTFIYNANLFKIEGTFAVPEYHFYYNGTMNGWNPETAIEFTNGDSAFTLAMDSLYGEFKIMTARDWSVLSYGANSESAQVNAGVPYVMAEWAANNMVVNGVFADVTLEMTLVNGVATITIIAEEDTTSGGETPEPVEVNYYIKNNWDGAVDWTWQPMAWTADSLACTYTGVFGGTGVNINTEQSDNGSMWFTVADMAIGIGGLVPQAGDTVLFTFTIGMHTLAAEVVGRPGGEQQVTNYYIKNNWDGATDWTWQLMEAMPGEIWQYVGVYGGTGVNVNTLAADAGAIWFAESDWDIANNFVPQAGDTLMFWFIPADTLLRVHLIGRPGGEQQVTNYYIKNNWDGGDWTWEMMIPANDGLTYGYTGVFGGSGVNINTAAADAGALWFAVEDFSFTVLGYEPAAGDTIQFVYNPADTTLTAILVGRPGTIEPVVMVEVRLVPGVWDKDGAKFAAIVWNEGETMEMDGVFTDWMLGTDTVVTLIPADADSIAFGRLNPEAEVPAMEYVWNHTDKLAIDPSLIYTITGWGEAGADCSTGYWGNPEPIDPEGLEEIAIEGKEALKALENGVLYIYRNGKKYNVQGQVVR